MLHESVLSKKSVSPSPPDDNVYIRKLTYTLDGNTLWTNQQPCISSTEYSSALTLVFNGGGGGMLYNIALKTVYISLSTSLE